MCQVRGEGSTRGSGLIEGCNLLFNLAVYRLRPDEGGAPLRSWFYEPDLRSVPEEEQEEQD